MQFQSSLARLAAFAFFLLSFSMLVCAAPTPVTAPDAGELAARDSPLVARTYDYTSKCKDLLVNLKTDVKDQCDALVKCSKTAGCDVKPIIAKIVLLIQVFVDAIKAQVKLGATINVNLCIDLVIEIIVMSSLALIIMVQLKLCVGLSIKLFIQLNIVLGALVQLILGLSLDLVLKLAIQLKLRLAVSVYADLCLQLGLGAVPTILGLL
ncbi:hypothetical protein FRC08_011959 [Ceratobasidium sp. 394]|nr:hypothetical protein FRC08_011959 [Ceratobasidium sp. 394]